MSAAFTKGPWRYSRSGIVANANGVPLLHFYADRGTPADRSLTAAAPDLYEALDPVNVRAAAKLLVDAGHGLNAGMLILMADAQERALAKARGEQVSA